MDDCKYCDDLAAFNGKWVVKGGNRHAFNLRAAVAGDTLSAIICYKDNILEEANAKINYCPMCGRKLHD